MDVLLAAGDFHELGAREGLGREELDVAVGQVRGDGVVAFVELDQGGAEGRGECDGGMFFGGFHERIDVAVSDGGAGGVVEDDVGRGFGDFCCAGGDLVGPGRGGGAGELDAGEAEMAAEFLFGLVEKIVVDDELDLLDVVAVEEELDRRSSDSRPSILTSAPPASVI